MIPGRMFKVEGRQTNTNAGANAPPTVTTLTPVSGPPTTLLTIGGTGLTSATTVTINGVNAESFTVVSSTQITARVGFANSTGTVAVTTAHGTATSSGSFTIGSVFFASTASQGSGDGTATVAGTFGAYTLSVDNSTTLSTWLAGANCAAGKTLFLTNGTYQGAGSMLIAVAGKAGTSTAPIYVKALNEGSVLIDGQSARATVRLSSGNNYWVIEGLNVKASNVDCYSVSGNNNILRRCIGWDAPDDQNRYTFNLNGPGVTGTDCLNNLVEDCAGFGKGRKHLLFFGTPGPNTARRFWGRWQRSLNVGPKITMSLVYHSYKSNFENCLTTWDDSGMPAGDYLLVNQGPPYVPETSTTAIALPCTVSSSQTIAVSATTSSYLAVGLSVRVWSLAGNTGPNYNSNYFEGNITGKDSTHITINVTASAGSGSPTDWQVTPLMRAGAVDQATGPHSMDNNTTPDSQTVNCKVLGCIAYQKSTQTQQGFQLFTYSSIDNVTLRDCIGVYPTTGFGAGYQTFLLGPGTSHTGNSATNVTSFKGSSAATAMSINADWNATNAVEATTPAALYTGGMTMYTADGTHGAAVRFRYQDGSLTTTPLWPWPMSARILAATTTSGYTPANVDADIQAIFGTYP